MATLRARMPKPLEEEAVVELLTWDPSDGTEDDEDDLDDELPADEAFAGDEDLDEALGAEPLEEEPVTVEEVAADGYTGKKKAALPLDDRARSHPDLPRVKSTAFKRFIR